MSHVEAPQIQEAAVVESLPADKPRWQFSLRDVFGFTAAAASAAAVARFTAPGAFVLAAGLYLAWLNSRGRLEQVQTRRARPKVFWAAWLLLGVSLFLPAMKGCNNTVHQGWETATIAAQWEFSAAGEILVKRNTPSAEELPEALGFAAWMTLINLANVLALLSPLLLWRLQRGQGQWFGAALAVAAVAVWSVPLSDGMLIGCYMWCAGFLVLTMSYRIGWRVFAAMTAVAAVYIVASFL
jgi:hypothetical protein